MTLEEIITQENDRIARLYVVLDHRQRIRNLFVAVANEVSEREQVKLQMLDQYQRFRLDEPEIAHFWHEGYVILCETDPRK